jgi:hypothetical protein
MAQWQGDLMDLHYGHAKRKHDSEDAKDYTIKAQEVALKHPETDAIVKLTDDGFIDIFADDKLGVRLDPSTKSITLFGDNVNVLAQNLNLKTKPDGFTWNGRAFNSNILKDDDITTAIKNPIQYSDGMIQIMKDLGLPATQVTKEDN